VWLGGWFVRNKHITAHCDTRAGPVQTGLIERSKPVTGTAKGCSCPTVHVRVVPPSCRFVPSLRGDGIDVVIGVFKALCILGGECCVAVVCDARQPLSADKCLALHATAAAGRGFQHATLEACVLLCDLHTLA
jgi:hypothetical protein